MKTKLPAEFRACSSLCARLCRESVGYRQILSVRFLKSQTEEWPLATELLRPWPKKRSGTDAEKRCPEANRLDRDYARQTAARNSSAAVRAAKSSMVGASRRPLKEGCAVQHPGQTTLRARLRQNELDLRSVPASGGAYNTVPISREGVTKLLWRRGQHYFGNFLPHAAVCA